MSSTCPARVLLRYCRSGCCSSAPAARPSGALDCGPPGEHNQGDQVTRYGRVSSRYWLTATPWAWRTDGGGKSDAEDVGAEQDQQRPPSRKEDDGYGDEPITVGHVVEPAVDVAHRELSASDTGQRGPEDHRRNLHQVGPASGHRDHLGSLAGRPQDQADPGSIQGPPDERDKARS